MMFCSAGLIQWESECAYPSEAFVVFISGFAKVVQLNNMISEIFFFCI